MSNIICILDTCSVINIMAIDDANDLLFKKIFLEKKIEWHYCDEVIQEIKKNISKKSTINKEKSGSLLSKLYPTITNRSIENDCSDFFENVKSISGYKKENGEFFSAALALYLSQEKPAKVFFYTDDYPAHDDFEEFFIMNQIGGIRVGCVI